MLPLSPEPTVAKQKTEPTKPSLTSGAFLSFGPQTWEAREPGSPCSPPCLDPCGGRLGVEEQPEEEEEVLTHPALRAGTGYKNNTTPPGGAPPSHLASSPICSNRAGWLQWEEKADRQNPHYPPKPQRALLSSGLRDTKACFLQRSELYKGWVRYSVKGYQ